MRDLCRDLGYIIACAHLLVSLPLVMQPQAPTSDLAHIHRIMEVSKKAINGGVLAHIIMICNRMRGILMKISKCSMGLAMWIIILRNQLSPNRDQLVNLIKILLS